MTTHGTAGKWIMRVPLSHVSIPHNFLSLHTKHVKVYVPDNTDVFYVTKIDETQELKQYNYITF